jgi:hypothetical protein
LLLNFEGRSWIRNLIEFRWEFGRWNKRKDRQTMSTSCTVCIEASKRIYCEKAKSSGAWLCKHIPPPYVPRGGGSLQCSCPIKVKLQASATYLWDSRAGTRHVTLSSTSHWLMFRSRVSLRHWSTLRVAPKGRMIRRGETIIRLNMFIACYGAGWSVSKSTGFIDMMYKLVKGVVACSCFFIGPLLTCVIDSMNIFSSFSPLRFSHSLIQRSLH